jgi:uncharacterized protein YsxB (DUF464 family)
MFARTLNKCRSRKNSSMKAYLQCKTKNIRLGLACDNKNSIRYDVLEEIVLIEINKVIEKYYNNIEIEKNKREISYE